MNFGKAFLLDQACYQYLNNPLFLQFCLWFLLKSGKFFFFPEGASTFDPLNHYVAKKVDNVKVDFSQVEGKFPALSVALEHKDEVALRMLENVLGKCNKIKHIALSTEHPADSILRPTFTSLRSITIHHHRYENSTVEGEEKNLLPKISPLLFLQKWTENDILIHLQMDFSDTLSDTLNHVFNFCAHFNRALDIRVTSSDDDGTRSDCLIQTLVQMLEKWKQVFTVCLLSLDLSGSFDLDLNAGYMNRFLRQNFPLLTSIILNNCRLCLEDLQSLAKASAEGRLPVLRVLDISWNPNLSRHNPQTVEQNFTGSKSQGSLAVLLEEGFPKLSSLIARDCWLTPQDLNSLAQANVGGKIPRLASLD